MKTLNYKQLKEFLSKCEAQLDLTDFSRCVVYLIYDYNEVASSDYINSIHKVENTFDIDDIEYSFSDVQQDLILEYLHDKSEDIRQEWNEMKNDTYDVRDDQGY